MRWRGGEGKKGRRMKLDQIECSGKGQMKKRGGGEREKKEREREKEG